MWNLTPDYLASIKEELKGRRAAIQARIADELKAVDENIQEIENLERIAYAFAVKHLPEVVPQEVAAVTAAEVEPEPESEPVAMLEGQSAQSNGHDRVASSGGKGGISRWRMRLDAPADADKV